MRSIAFPVLDQTLTNAARDGRIVLFLGAGASMGSVNAKGDQIPNGKQLGALIAQRFLRKEHEEMDFKSICDFACSSSSVRDVQRFIYETLEGFQPTAMHRRLPDFVWAGLATTNYDLLVERAYAQNTKRLQNLLVYSRNGSSVLHRRGQEDINRLALIYASQDLPNEALDVLRRGLENNPGSRLLHYRYAQALLRVRPDADTSDADTMKYHLQRSFSPGDTNYEAQFWYARQLCLMGAEAEARPMFEAVAKLKLPFLIRNAIEGYVKEADGQLRVFSGEVQFVNANGGYGFIQQNSPALRAFFSNRESAAALRKGDRVRFNLGFTIRGPIATGINRQT